jgi:hypothetical protein
MSTSIDLSLASVPRTKNGLIMPEGVVFYYLHRSDGSAGGCVCLGAVVGNRVGWYKTVIPSRPVRFCRGISFCSRQDRFSRATGRELAYRRFLKAVKHKQTGEPIQRSGLGQPFQPFSYKSCSDTEQEDVMTQNELNMLVASNAAKPTTAKRRSAAKPIPLNAMDRRELKAAGSPQGALPRFCDGEQSNAQWRCWQKLQRFGLAVIEGGREAERLRRTSTRKINLELLAAKPAKRKRTCRAS